MKTILAAGLLAALAITGTASAGPLTVTIGASQDATIFANNPSNSLDAGPVLFAGLDGMSGIHRGLIEFNVAGSVPKGATIESVQLNLTLGQVAGANQKNPSAPANQTIELQAVTSNWNVTTGVSATGADESMIGTTGAGFPANNGDVTWNATSFPGTAWTTSGGDFKSAASASTVVSNVVGVTSSWSSTVAGNAGLLSDVQNWLNNPNQNFGWLVKNADETTPTDYRAFFTKDALSLMTPTVTTSELPQLVITYTLAAPEPATSAMLGLGLAICGAFRLAVRRRKALAR